MISTRPYLIRAFYEWIVEIGCTPYIVVNTNVSGVNVPKKYSKSGQIVLNIAMYAVQSLLLGNDSIIFKARFAGILQNIYLPIYAVTAIYAFENGQGMIFTIEENAPPPEGVSKECIGSSVDCKNGERKQIKRPHLTIVK